LFIFWNNTIVGLWRWILNKVIIKIKWRHAWYPLLHQHRQVNWQSCFTQLHKTMSGFIKIAAIEANEPNETAVVQTEMNTENTMHWPIWLT
jgi:hypothetical protein